MNQATWVSQHSPHHIIEVGPLEFTALSGKGKPVSTWKVAHHDSKEPHDSCKSCKHKSHDEAVSHWREHLLKHELEKTELADASTATCIVCGSKATHLMSIGKHPIIADRLSTCAAHAHRAAIEPHFTMPPKITMVYASQAAMPTESQVIPGQEPPTLDELVDLVAKPRPKRKAARKAVKKPVAKRKSKSKK